MSRLFVSSVFLVCVLLFLTLFSPSCLISSAHAFLLLLLLFFLLLLLLLLLLLSLSVSVSPPPPPVTRVTFAQCDFK